MGITFFQSNGLGEVFYAFKMSDWLGKSICILLLVISIGIHYCPVKIMGYD